MSAKTSVKYYRPPTKASFAVRRAVSIAVVIAIMIVSAGIVSFASANTLMRQKPDQLASFSSNVMPPFSVISFQSLDEQTTLSGWMFPAQGKPISTVIMVHDSGKNRLQFEIDMPALYEFFVENHYNVLSFDLRHAGKSEGQLSAYGYAEWEDVLAAIQYARQFTTTKDVLLYGFGSGVTTTLFAWARLPDPATAEKLRAEIAADAEAKLIAETATTTSEAPVVAEGSATSETVVSEPSVKSVEVTPAVTDKNSAADKALSLRIAALGFDRSYVRGVLLDTPCVSPDSYIKAVYQNGNLLGKALLQFTVPYAVRLSATSTHQNSLVTILTQVQKPVFLAYSKQDNWVGTRSIQPLIDERLRLHPDTTSVYADPDPGYVAGFTNNQGAYLSALKDYLSRFIG
ncbi:MAG: hypothetical protein PHC86_09065 [Eubacteriales bacterium]|nr:hypothetical protein [Eubacteriales bacterium]